MKLVNRKVVVTLVLVCATVTAACASAGSTRPGAESLPRTESVPGPDPQSSLTKPVEPVTYAPIVSPSPSTDISTTLAIQETLRGLDADEFVSASIGTPPSKDWQGPWFYATVRGAQLKDSEYLSSVWEADLAEGAAAELSNKGFGNLSSVITGSTVTIELPDGTSSVVENGAIGDIAAGQSLGSAESDDAIITKATSIVEKYGLKATSIRVLHPLGAALDVIVTTPTLEAVAGRVDSLNLALEGSPAQYDGVYLEVRDNAGGPIARLASSLRSGVSWLWIRPGLSVDLGTAHG